MTFLFTEDGRDDDVRSAFRRYREYLESVRNSFPATAYALAASEWYFNPQDRRCPHDAWLESMSITEPSSGSRNELRTVSMRMRLLGAYHDGYIDLLYPQVFAYQAILKDCRKGHLDWRYDELRLSDQGHVIHEIEWSGAKEAGRWLIEASDVHLVWVPIET